jgi:putative heme-binding domain-containing protein
MWRWPVCVLLAGAAAAQTDVAGGRKIFESQCALCHGQTGGGGRGPSLNRATLDHAPNDKALRKVISEGLEPEMPGAWQLNDHEIGAVAAYVRSLGAAPQEKLAGDPARGGRVFETRGCAGCHMVAGKGSGFGPELTQIGSRRNAAHLRQTILKPAESLPEGFAYFAATDAAGRAVRGIRVNEDTFTIQLKDVGGRFHSFRKSELKDLRRLENETPMPAYQGQLAGAELDDLVAYLASLRGKS